MIVTIARNPAKPSIPSLILNALTRPTTAKIVKGIASLPNSISFEPNGLPNDVIHVSVNNNNNTQEIIWTRIRGHIPRPLRSSSKPINKTNEAVISK